jgi:acyl-CoA synthetase (AMP-forming)/AMP-acid ligase II
MISNRNLTYNSEAIHVARKQELADDSVMLTWTPLFHDMGLLLGVFQGVYDNHISILMTPIAFIQKPIRWLRAISKYRATLSGGPNFAFAVCNDKISPQDCEGIDLSTWRLAYNSAEPVRAETQDGFYKKFSPYGFKYRTFFPCYGLAETTLLVSGYGNAKETITYPADRNALEEGQVIPCDQSDPKNCNPQVCCGSPLLGIQTVIVDPVSQEHCHPDEIGEIWVSGGNVAEGYWNRDDETRESFQARIKDSNEGPFLRTGDLGFVHAGQLYVTGRYKDLIIVRGRNYYPQDIEDTVQKSHPAMRPGGGAAFSIKKDGTEHLVIIQEVRKEYLDPSLWDQASINEVFKTIRYDIAREHGIRASCVTLIIPSTIPKTSSGKIMRSECQELFHNGELKTVVEWRAPIL